MSEARSPAGRRHSRRHRRLLASVAGFAIAAALAGPGLFGAAPGRWQTLAGAAEPAPHGDAPPQAAAARQPQGFADLVAKVKPAVISVRVRIDNPAVGSSAPLPALPGPPLYRFFRQFGWGGQGDEGAAPKPHETITGEGSGFFISADGYALTNDHVVDHATSVEVTTDDGTKYTAKVIGTDQKTDLALLKVDAAKEFAYVKFADQPPRVGDWVVAVGNPFGLGGTVTAGIVSARGRDIGRNAYDDYLQIDAPINKGNSGGPAFNADGEVIGVNTAIYSPSGGSVGIGFDIPADTAKMVEAQLRQKGYVTRGWMGVQVQPVTAGIADNLGLKTPEGALIDQLQPDSPAAKAGIKAGDVITAMNGQPVKDARRLAMRIAIAAPGSTVELNILRDGQSKTVDLTLGTMPKQQEANAGEDAQQQGGSGTPDLGLSLAPAQDVAGAGDKGVVVTDVEPGGVAAEQGLESGDVILDVGGEAVNRPSDVSSAIHQTRSSGKRMVPMRVREANGTRFVAIPLAQR